MIIIHDERSSDSPYIETVMCGQTISAATTVRPAEYHWHMVLCRLDGKVQSLVVGPLTKSGFISYSAGAELLWIKFALGTFMPDWPAKDFLDLETVLPDASSQSFWLNGSTWQFPNYDNVEIFVNRLVRDKVLVCDPLIKAALQDQLPEMPPRTLRHRFLRATGLSKGQIRQMMRAQQAQTLLQQGLPILDTVFAAGYFDQPHLTRSLKQYVGLTPVQVIQAS
ncbi:MAG: helix-turn-helix domain-containing protein [Anaerolineaceae bacterium]|nr:helix-turn-helix domain-containing protein [Anaerolineaceae bacterium]